MFAEQGAHDLHGAPRAGLVMSPEAEADLAVVWDGVSCGPAARVQSAPLSSSSVAALVSLRVKRGSETHRTVAFNVEVGVSIFLFCLFVCLEMRQPRLASGFRITA